MIFNILEILIYISLYRYSILFENLNKILKKFIKNK